MDSGSNAEPPVAAAFNMKERAERDFSSRQGGKRVRRMREAARSGTIKDACYGTIAGKWD